MVLSVAHKLLTAVKTVLEHVTIISLRLRDTRQLRNRQIHCTTLHVDALEPKGRNCKNCNFLEEDIFPLDTSVFDLLYINVPKY